VRQQPRGTAEPGSEMHARKGCSCCSVGKAHALIEPGLDIVDGSLESARRKFAYPRSLCRSHQESRQPVVLGGAQSSGQRRQNAGSEVSTAPYQQVSPQQGCREGTSGGNFSSHSRKHLSNQSLGLQFDSNPGSHFMLYFNGLSIFCHLDSSDSYHLSRGRSIDLKLHTRGSMSTLPHELTIGIACLEDRIEPVKRLLRSPAKTCPSATGQPQPQGSDRSGIDNRSLRPSVTVCRTP